MFSDKIRLATVYKVSIIVMSLGAVARNPEVLLFRQAWAKMIDVEGGTNPLIKDTALDSKGYF